MLIIIMDNLFVSVLSKFYNKLSLSNNNEPVPAWEQLIGLSWTILDEE